MRKAVDITREHDTRGDKMSAFIRPIIKVPTCEIAPLSIGDIFSVNNDVFLSDYLANMGLELDEQYKAETDYIVASLMDEETWLISKHPLTVKLIKKEKT